MSSSEQYFLDLFAGITRRKKIEQMRNHFRSKKINLLAIVNSFVSDVRQRDLVSEYDNPNNKVVFFADQLDHIYKNEKDFNELMTVDILKMENLLYFQLKGNILDHFSEQRYKIILGLLTKINARSIDARFNLLPSVTLLRFKAFLEAIEKNPHIVAFDISQCLLGRLAIKDDEKDTDENIAKFNLFLKFLEKKKLKYLDISSSNLHELTPRYFKKLLDTIQLHQTELEFLNLGNNVLNILILKSDVANTNEKLDNAKTICDFIAKNKTIRNLNLMGVESLSKQAFQLLSQAIQDNANAKMNKLAVAFDYSPLIQLDLAHLKKRTDQFMQAKFIDEKTKCEHANIPGIPILIKNPDDKSIEPKNLKEYITKNGGGLGPELAHMLNADGLKATSNVWSLTHIKPSVIPLTRVKGEASKLFIADANADQHKSIPTTTSLQSPSTAIVFSFPAKSITGQDVKVAQDVPIIPMLPRNWEINDIKAKLIRPNRQKEMDIKIFDRKPSIVDKNDELFQEKFFRLVVIDLLSEHSNQPIKCFILLARDPMLPPNVVKGIPKNKLEALLKEQPCLKHYESSNLFIHENLKIIEEEYNRPGIRILCFKTGDMPKYFLDVLFEFFNKVNIFSPEEMIYFKEYAGQRKMSDATNKLIDQLENEKIILKGKLQKMNNEIQDILQKCNSAFKILAVLHEQYPKDSRYALDFSQLLLDCINASQSNNFVIHKLSIAQIALKALNLITTESIFYQEAREKLSSIHECYLSLDIESLAIEATNRSVNTLSNEKGVLLSFSSSGSSNLNNVVATADNKDKPSQSVRAACLT